jgi:hypothetical protein
MSFSRLLYAFLIPKRLQWVGALGTGTKNTEAIDASGVTLRACEWEEAVGK